MLQKWGHTTKQVSFYLFLLFFCFGIVLASTVYVLDSKTLRTLYILVYLGCLNQVDIKCRSLNDIQRVLLPPFHEGGAVFFPCVFMQKRAYVALPKWPINQFRLLSVSNGTGHCNFSGQNFDSYPVPFHKTKQDRAEKDVLKQEKKVLEQLKDV